jgi:nicotinate-nucleotide--dimethylbenzimidazole phosphoribosyltransferase
MDKTVVLPPLDTDAMAQARARQDQLTKPRGALGQLEALSIQLAGMTGRLDWLPTRRAVVVCAGDHGVAAQGVSAYPQAVTYQMVLNFLRGGAAVNVLARQMNARVTVLDAGVIGDFDEHPALIRRKIAAGTADLTRGAAMTIEQALQSLHLGYEIAQQEIERGLEILAVGEMGIGNTTSASAIIAAITGKHVVEVTGHGTGISLDQYSRKIEMIKQALRVNAPAYVDTLAKVGGFEIGAMAGLMLGAAMKRIPIVIDGIVSTAAALIAEQTAPRISDYLIAGHRSVERGHIVALNHLRLQPKPLFDLGMRLGEGTGAVLAFPLIEAAMRTLNEMATFGEAGVSDKDAE